jgi:hypothetical protein
MLHQIELANSVQCTLLILVGNLYKFNSRSGELVFFEPQNYDLTVCICKALQVLATIMQQFRVSLPVGGAMPSPKAMITLRPENRVNLRLTSRKQHRTSKTLTESHLHLTQIS